MRIFTVRLDSLIDLINGPRRRETRSLQPMEDCAKRRPQQEQAEVQQRGPYSSIVLAVLR